MPSETRSLIRFVQVRRYVPGGDRDEPDCSFGDPALGSCFDLRDDWSPEVAEAVQARNQDRILVLLNERRDVLNDSDRLVAGLAHQLLRLATVNAELTVGRLRQRRAQWLEMSGLDARTAVQSLERLTRWTVDVATLLRCLRPKAPVMNSPLVRILRGIVLIRLANSNAEDSCRVHDLIHGRSLLLPPLPAGRRSVDPTLERAQRLQLTAQDLERVRTRILAGSEPREVVLSDLDGAQFPDLVEPMKRLREAARSMGLSPATSATAFKRILEVEYADARRTLDRRGFEPIDQQYHGGLDSTYIPPLLDPVEEDEEPVVPVLHAYARVIGRGDLMIVRTRHLRYELGPIAHIENVLASEVRERTHLVDTTTSESVTETLQTLEETTQELETTEQSSLERATQTVASRSSTMTLGVSVSGGLGPVQAGIDINVSSSTSTSSSTSAAVSYATNLTEKASELLRTEAGYRRTTTSRTRVTETNLHRFDNAESTQNIAGIYRWVDKVDEAQLYNYGERLLLECIVPEPAAHYVYMKTAAEAEGELRPPPAWNLDFDELHPGNYVAKATRWNVLGLEPPPPNEVYASATFVDPPARPYDYEQNSTDKSQPEWGYAAYVGEVNIPEGYFADTAYVTTTWGLSEGEGGITQTQAVQVAVGERRVWMNDEDANAERTVGLDREIGGPLPIGISTDQRGGVTVIVRVRCERTDEALDAWRLRTYETIRAGYLAMLEQYETDLRLRAARQGYVAATSPDQNRLIEVQELKRGAQTLLTGQDFHAFGSVNFPTGNLPRMDRMEAKAEADYIQFFEDCFEWENLTYLFYPYQWAGRDRWTELQGRASSDPLHQAFLQAGAARVVVPVRGGYEDIVGRYLDSSEIPRLLPRPWRGVRRNPYPPIEDLIADALDRPEGEIAIEPPWEVVTPTSLIYLQPGSELNPPAE